MELKKIKDDIYKLQENKQSKIRIPIFVDILNDGDGKSIRFIQKSKVTNKGDFIDPRKDKNLVVIGLKDFQDFIDILNKIVITESLK